MNEPRVVESVTNECQSLGRAHESSSARAEQLIACLEGEIAKRDARIVELKAAWQQATVARKDELIEMQEKENDLLRAELSAIKAQEPVAYIPVDRETGEEWHPVLKKGSGNICDYKPLYAAPVSEAKAQGVVMPEPCADCNGLGFGAFGCCGECYGSGHKRAAPVQQVSVPDVSAMARILADRNADACNVNREDNWAIYGQDYIDDVTAMLAATAAPTADACKACKGTGRRPIGGRGRIFGLTNRCFECQPLTAEEVYGDGDTHDQ